MLYIGIDPGVSGGIALLTEVGEVVEVLKMPETERDLLDVFLPVKAGRAVIERVSAFAPAGQRMGATSAFTFGKGYGRLLMALTAAAIPFDEIVPMKWQSIMGCRTGGDKNVSKRRAQQLFPNQKVTHAIADALLLAECCRRLAAGNVVHTRADLNGRYGKKSETVKVEESRQAEVEVEAAASGGRPEETAAASAPRRGRRHHRRD
jgi:crossover junction endodeoxyribonuclease RuvC